MMNLYRWCSCIAVVVLCSLAASAVAQSVEPTVQPLTPNLSTGDMSPFTNGSFTTQNVPTGTGGILITNHINIEKHEDWSKFDYFKFDVYNPSDTAVPMVLEIRDAQTKDYYTRVNVNSAIRPGKSTMTFPLKLYVGEKAHPGRMLLTDEITRVVITVIGKPVVASNFRLERMNTDRIVFPGLHAYSFGEADAPLMETFTRVLTTTNYSPEAGYGWENAQFWHSMNALQPDTLTESYITPTSGDFRIDLPNGRYHVEMNLDSPNDFWGDVQNYTSRTVTANGQVVVHDIETMDSFIKRYFRNAHREDLPGLNTFDQYVQKMFDIKKFDVDVTDGKLELGFEGALRANCLSYIIVYPQTQAEKGQAYLKWVVDQRRDQFNDYFKQVEPKRSPQPSSGYVVFTRPIGVPVNAYDGPRPGETVADSGLTLTVAKTEISPVQFAVQPSSEDLGSIDLKISRFVGPHGSALEASSFQPGWIDYRITRVEADGSIYTAAPRYWHPTPAPDAPNVTRRFWVNVQTPANAVAGDYKGTITVVPQHGQSQAIPVTITVLPFVLDPVTDVAAGPFGCGIGIDWRFDPARAQAWDLQVFAKSLDALREGGCTTFTGIPQVHIHAANGRVYLDTAEADAQMELARSKGFHMIVSSYNYQPGAYQLYGILSGPHMGPDVDAAHRAGFRDMHSFLLAVYTAIDQHAQAHNWLPVAWNLCDEPIGDAVVEASAANAQAHRDISGNLRLTTFTGATSMEGDDPSNPHIALIRALPIPALNGHDEASLQVVKEAGDKLSFYNGASRWTYGRYMKMLVLKHDLVLRVSWHFAAVAGDPYYALDCREDDYCWFNTDETQTLVPSMSYLAVIVPGLNDYRYYSMLQRLLKTSRNAAAVAAGQKLFDQMMDLKAGKDRNPPDHKDPYKEAAGFDRDRAAVTQAICDLLK